MKATKKVIQHLNKQLTIRADCHQPVLPACTHVQRTGASANWASTNTKNPSKK